VPTYSVVGVVSIIGFFPTESVKNEVYIKALSCHGFLCKRFHIHTLTNRVLLMCMIIDVE
jgi:hypothetical protein